MKIKNIMIKTPNVNISAQDIEHFCKKWNVREFYLFGSSVQGEFHPESDVDVMVSFAPQANYSLLDLVDMEEELKELFGRRVDIVEKQAIEKSENYIRRNSILNSCKILYAA